MHNNEPRRAGQPVVCQNNWLQDVANHQLALRAIKSGMASAVEAIDLVSAGIRQLSLGDIPADLVEALENLDCDLRLKLSDVVSPACNAHRTLREGIDWLDDGPTAQSDEAARNLWAIVFASDL